MVVKMLKQSMDGLVFRDLDWIQRMIEANDEVDDLDKYEINH